MLKLFGQLKRNGECVVLLDVAEFRFSFDTPIPTDGKGREYQTFA